MAKKGIEYFPMVCYMDDSFELLEAEFGLLGFAVIIKILQKIYGGEGYFCSWTKEVSLLFAKKNGFLSSDKTVLTKEVDCIVERAMERDIFSKEAFEKYSILTSKNIQKTFLLITKRRKEVDIIPQYIVLSDEELIKYSCNFKKNADKSKGNDVGLNQRKVKESEGKKSEEKERKTAFGKFKNVFLTQNEHNLLISSFGEEKTRLCIEFLDEYIEDKGYFHNDSFLTIKRWVLSAVEDRLRKKEKEFSKKEKEKSKFVNYTQRDWDFEKLEQMDRELLEKECSDNC